MTTRDLANEPMAFSLLANRDVSTWSWEWQHECEIAYLLDMSAEKRKAMLYGVTGGEGDEARGIKHHRGDAAVAQLVAEIARLQQLRSENQKAPASRR
ncbi:hypothetical protein [Bosea sp. BK604]|uniref:DUF7696 family protein n=1 Tax=Bosea sp. BK604 TaxID=2512180 RepID=UPI001050AAED|nr:hypothetical protein [Bosea sp. BK604]TCR65657.1 hypothetical protein EV560_105420 [Bosea sp. BK604]